MGRVRAVRRWSGPVTALIVGLSLALTACGGGSAGASSSGSALSLVAFSVPKPAYDDLQRNFADSPDGKGVTWKSSYGASGDQARAVISGLPADYVGFSLNSDMTKLVDKGLVAQDWDAGATKGIVSTSVVAIVVRKGNPLGIHGWDDLTKPGVKIVTPNPGSRARRAGTCWPPGVAHHRERGLRGRGHGLPDEVLQERGQPALEAAGRPPAPSPAAPVTS